MKYKFETKKVICAMLALLIATASSGILTEAKVAKVQKEMAEEVFRFHVLANSDSDRDQALKMQVKEKVIAYMEEELPSSESVDMTKSWAKSHLKEIEELAEATLQEEGCDYEVSAKVTNCYFPDKTYGDVTFPKGYYDALRIEIGQAKGQNWWCVLYPNLCFIDSVKAVVPKEGKKQLEKVLDEEGYKLVTKTPKFKIKWFFFR